MMHAYLQVGPQAWILPVCAIVLAVALRYTRWALVPALAFLAALLQVASFDGQQHLTEKFDATFIVWVRTVILRAVSGVSLLILALPFSAAAARWARWTRTRAIAFYVLMPVGVGLLASSLAIQSAVRNVLSDPSADPLLRYDVVESVVHASNFFMVSGAVLAVVGALRLAVPLWRRRGAEEKFWEEAEARETSGGQTP